LKPVALKEEMSADSSMELNNQPAQIGAQFVVAEETFYLILRAFSTSSIMPGESAAGFLLLHPDGRTLDCVQMACSNREAELSAILLNPLGGDGAQLVMTPSPGWGKQVEPTISYRLHPWRRITREGVTAGRGTPEKDGICRLRISGASLEILTPAPR